MSLSAFFADQKATKMTNDGRKTRANNQQNTQNQKQEKKKERNTIVVVVVVAVKEGQDRSS